MKSLKLFSIIGSFLLIGFSSCETVDPAACFTSSATTVTVGDNVSFTNCSENASGYEWDFGDLGTSTAENPVYVYTQSGNYNIVLKAKNSSGSKVDFMTATITVVCPDGTQDDCSIVDDRTDFVGNFDVYEVCSESKYSDYEAAITLTSASTTDIDISNFWNFFVNPVVATVDGKDIIITPQEPDGDDYYIQGSGRKIGDDITIDFTIDKTGTTIVENCTATFTLKQ